MLFALTFPQQVGVVLLILVALGLILAVRGGDPPSGWV